MAVCRVSGIPELFCLVFLVSHIGSIAVSIAAFQTSWLYAQEVVAVLILGHMFDRSAAGSKERIWR